MFSLIHALFFEHDPSIILPRSFFFMLIELPIEIALFTYFFIDRASSSQKFVTKIKGLEFGTVKKKRLPKK